MTLRRKGQTIEKEKQNLVHYHNVSQREMMTQFKIKKNKNKIL